MKNTFRICAVLLLAGTLLLGACAGAGTDTIKIGVNAPLTGDIPREGEQTKFAAEMWLEDIGSELEVGGETYTVELFIEDNESKGESAAAVNTKLITQDEVLVIVGPQASKQAVPAGGVANDLETPMISPWSTNPNTTLNRPWVFRAPFLDPFQGPVVANFVSEEFGFTKAGVLYDVASDYPKGLADNFKQGWENLHGAGSVVAFESFTTGDTDFSAQLTKIMDAGAEFLFTPQYYNEVPLIVQQAHQLGWDVPIVGSDSWGSPDTVELCGEDCYGAFFSTHYAAEGATGATKEFIDSYNEKYGYVPADVAALTWDSFRIVQQAIQDCGEITGDLEADRKCVRDAMANIKNFQGITGEMTFTEEGDPIKCAVIVQITDEGKYAFYKEACP
jgi:branched-chain amino acid transport system substrate-binding protein